MAPRSDAEVEPWPWDVQFLEELFGHLSVVVLASVEDVLFNKICEILPNGVRHSSRLYELWSGSYYCQYFFHEMVLSISRLLIILFDDTWIIRDNVTKTNFVP